MKLFKRAAALALLVGVILAGVFASSVFFVDRGALARLLGGDGGPQGRQDVVLEPVLVTLPALGGGRTKPQPVFVSVTLEVAGARQRAALCNAVPRAISVIFTDLAPQVTRLMSDAASLGYQLHPRQQARFNEALGDNLIDGGRVFVHPLSTDLPKATCPKPRKEPFQDG